MPQCSKLPDLEFTHLHLRICVLSRLDAFVWDTPKRVDVVHSVVRWHLANRRQGTAMVRLLLLESEAIAPIFTSCMHALFFAGKDGEPDPW